MTLLESTTVVRLRSVGRRSFSLGRCAKQVYRAPMRFYIACGLIALLVTVVAFLLRKWRKSQIEKKKAFIRGEYRG